MRIVIQRVRYASLSIGGSEYSAIGKGMVVLVGVEERDTMDDGEWLVKKTVQMRIYDDENGVMNRSLIDTGGNALVVSQFTLHAMVKKGNRPAYIRAARPEHARPLYEAFCERMSQALGRAVATGVFGADMQVELLNDGPVTIFVDSQNRE